MPAIRFLLVKCNWLSLKASCALHAEGRPVLWGHEAWSLFTAVLPTNFPSWHLWSRKAGQPSSPHRKFHGPSQAKSPPPPPHAMGEIPQPALLNHVNHDACKADPDQRKRGCTRKQCNPSSATVCSCLRCPTLTGTSSRNLAPRRWAQHNYSSPAATQRPSLPVQGAGGFPSMLEVAQKRNTAVES